MSALAAAAMLVVAMAAPAPAAPYISYASGLKWTSNCLPLTIGIQRSASAVSYEVFADSTRLGSIADTGSGTTVWGVLHFTRPGPQTVTARAVDAAGTRSAPSNTRVVTASAC